MRNLISLITTLGLNDEADIIERRRIIMLNTFTLIIVILIVTLTIVNFFAGPASHALTIFSSLIFILPVYWFSYKQKHQLSRMYFIIMMLLVINILSYRSLFNFGNRYNEVYFIGFSAVIILLLDHWKKITFFLVAVASALIMYLVRWNHLGVEFSSDTTVALVNVSIAFLCIFLTTTIFKDDLVTNLAKNQKYANQLEQQQLKIIEANKELATSKHLLRNLIDSLPILIAMMDTDGKYIIVNRKYQEIFELKLEDIEGKNSFEILGESLHEQRKPLFERCLNGKEAILNYTITLPHGKPLHAFGKYLPMFDENDQVSGVLVYVTDVSRLKEVEHKLQGMNATKDKLLSIISHDLKSPINSLKGLLSVADSLSLEEFKNFMSRIQQQVDTVAFTLDNLLNWVRTQLEGFSVEPEDINLKELVNQCLSLYQEQLKSKKISVAVEGSTDCTVFADRENTSLVCRNLISNAVKFTPGEGTVRISYSSDNGKTILSVEDSGIGMSADIVDSIMNDVEQNITRNGTSGEKGTGLGLAFCKDVLALNNARLKISSQPNKGTQIQVIFERNTK